MKFSAPFEILGPCRSRIIAGLVMFAALAVLVYLLSG